MLFELPSFRSLLFTYFLWLIQAIVPLQVIKAELSHIDVLDKAIDQIYQMSLSGHICRENLQNLYQEWRSVRINLNDNYKSQRVYAEYGEKIITLALDNKPQLINKFAAQILEGTINKGILPFFINALARKSDYENLGVNCGDERSEVHILHLSSARALVIFINAGVYNESADFLLLERIGNDYKLSKYVPSGEKYEELNMSTIAVETNRNELRIWPRPVSYANGDGEVWKITDKDAYLIKLNPMYGYLPIDKDIEKLTPIERLIYNVEHQDSTYALRRLDRILNFVYKKACITHSDKNLLKKQQRAWLKARPKTEKALKRVYKERILELLEDDALLSSFCEAILSGLFQDGNYFYDETGGYVDYLGERLGVIAHALYKKYYGSAHLPAFNFDAYHYSSMVKVSDHKVFIFWATKSEMRDGNVALYFVCMVVERKAKGGFSVKLAPFPGQPPISNIKPEGERILNLFPNIPKMGK